VCLSHRLRYRISAALGPSTCCKPKIWPMETVHQELPEKPYSKGPKMVMDFKVIFYTITARLRDRAR